MCACVAKTFHTDIHQPMVDQMVHCNKTRCTHGASGVGERDKNRVRATATVPACLCRRNNAADPISRECFLSFTIPIPRNERSCRPSLTRSLSLSLAFPNCRRQAEEPKTTEAAAAKDAKVERVSLRQRWQSNNKPDTTMAIPRAKRGVLDNYVQCRIRIVQRELLNHFRSLKPNHHHRGRWNIERTND